jgi:hypothetical protein
MILWFISTVTYSITASLFGVLHGLVYLSLFLCCAYKVGWIDRFIWFMAEREASKLLNRTPVSIGSLKIDWNWLRGKMTVHVTNVIIHTPHRELWQWESPLLARIGSVSVEANIIITLANLILLREEIPLEVYTAQVSDVQVFVERQRNIFNFYLMDKAMMLPDPRDLQRQTKTSKQQQPQPQPKLDGTSESTNGNGIVDEHNRPLTVEASDSCSSVEGEQSKVPKSQQDGLEPPQQQQSPPPDTTMIHAEDSVSQEKAQQLVHDMLQAVKQLGRAAKKNGLKDALHKQGYTLATKLRNIPSDKSGKVTLTEGVTLMQQVGKVAVESLKSSKLDQLVPQRHKRSGKKPPVARVGRVVLKQIRIFTRDSWIRESISGGASTNTVTTTTTNNNNSSHVGGGGGGGGAAPMNNTSTLSSHNTTATGSTPLSSTMTATATTATPSGITVGWNKPITIQEVVIRAAELCPPMSLTDEDGLPVIYQPMDKIVEVVWRRVLAESAKTNTGRLFQTAVGEALAYIKPPSTTTNNNNKTSTSTSTSSNGTKGTTTATTTATIVRV